MKLTPLSFIVVVIASALLAPMPLAVASGFNVDRQLLLVEHAVKLTSDQSSEVLQILRQQRDAIIDAKTDSEKMAINQAARAKIRDLLSDEQKVKWDATPQSQGGGMGRQTTNDLTQGLRRAFDLSGDQMSAAAKIFQQERVQVAQLPDGSRSGSPAYQGIVAETGHQIRAILSPNDQIVFDAVGDRVTFDLSERVKIVRMLKASTALAGAVGGIQSIKLKSGSVSQYSTDGAQATVGGGTYNVTVVGSAKSADYVVKFSGKSFSSALNLEVTDSSGAAVAL